MASSMPIPVPPRTPTPPSDDDSFQASGLGLDGLKNSLPSRSTFDPNSLSPLNDTFPGRYSSFPKTMPTPAIPYSPESANSTSASEMQTIQPHADDVESSKNPFKFQSQTYNPKSPVKSNVGQRRGHKYKHSSVSHQIFLEPTPRAPLRLPASLPIPTAKEGWRSMTTEQTLRFMWCFCHLFVAAFVQWTAQGSLAVTALSHLIFYDAIGAFLCAGVEVLSNFEVWKSASIRQPFGLERSEVLVGFAMSILLLFMGFDLISHNATHLLEGVGTHEPHHEHRHKDRVPSGSLDLVSLLAIISTLVSAVMLKNHARIAKSMRFAYTSLLPSVLGNPSHLLTLSCSSILLVMPLLSLRMYTWLDRGLSGVMALAMCFLGFQLVKTLGAMLLMSYSGPGVSEVIRDMEKDPSVSRVEEAKFWQVHYGLCMANLKLRVRGSDESLARLRERVTSLVKNRLGGGYGAGGQSWEISTQLILETD